MKKLMIFAAGSILLTCLYPSNDLRSFGGSPAQAFTYNKLDAGATELLDTRFLGSDAPRVGLSRFTGGAGGEVFSVLDTLRGGYSDVEAAAPSPAAAALTEEFLPQQAFVYNEIDDAGELLTTGQAITFTEIQTPGAGLTINGTLTAKPDSNGNPTPDADLYAISLVGGVPLTATVTSSTNGGTIDDTALFLFDPAGVGVAYNQDIADEQNFPPPTFPAGTNYLSSITYTPQVTGTYYLAISWDGTGDDPNSAGSSYQPLDATGSYIWYVTNEDGLPTPPDTDNEYPPSVTITEPVSTLPLAGWNLAFRSPVATFDYTIAAAIPEPSIGGGLLALGGMSLAALGRRKKTLRTTK